MHRKRSSFTRSSAAIIGGNDDLLMEILLFLPAKSLIRFKLVSKHWRSLISSQYFSHLHTFHRRRLRPQQSFFLRACTSKFFVCDPTIGRLIPFHFRFRGLVRILQSCNGLLLLQCRNIGRNEYHIFNPTTMQSRNLLLNCGYVDGFCLIFDPSESPHYKVVCFPAFTNSTSFLVYHSENHEWKEVGKSCLTYKFWVGLHLNEDFHFVKSRYASFRVIPNPPRVGSPGDEKNYTMESNGCLHHLRLCLLPDKNELHVYETKEIRSGWSKTVLAVDLNPTSSAFSGKNGTAIDLLGIIRGETINDSVLLFHLPGKIIIYRFVDEVSEVLVDFTGENGFGKDRLQFRFYDAHQFICSLAPV